MPKSSFVRHCDHLTIQIQELLQLINTATIKTIKNEIKCGKLSPKTKHRSSKYINSIIEQDHRSIKRITNTMLGFKHFKSACSTIQGIEAMNMIRKKQANTHSKSGEIKMINKIFGVA